jgi:hypothetical protein
MSGALAIVFAIGGLVLLAVGLYLALLWADYR